MKRVSKKRFALELLDRIFLHFVACAQTDVCDICRLYSLVYDELNVPYAQEIDWIMETRERWAERIQADLEQLELLIVPEPPI